MKPDVIFEPGAEVLQFGKTVPKLKRQDQKFAKPSSKLKSTLEEPTKKNNFSVKTKTRGSLRKHSPTLSTLYSACAMILKMLDETFEDDGWNELYTCSCLEGTSCDMPFQLVERRETTLSLASRWEAGIGLQEVTLSAILLYISTPPPGSGPAPDTLLALAPSVRNCSPDQTRARPAPPWSCSISC